MGLTCFILLAVFVVIVIECKPFSDYVEKSPCVDCEQKNFRRKRSYQFVFTQGDQDFENFDFTLGCLDCDQNMEYSYTASYTMTSRVSVNDSPDVYIGNGKNNENHVIVNGANNVYIGNGDHNTNYVTNNS